MFAVRRIKTSRNLYRLSNQVNNPHPPSTFLTTNIIPLTSLSPFSTSSSVASSSRRPYISDLTHDRFDIKGKGRAVEYDIPQTGFLLNVGQNGRSFSRTSVQRVAWEHRRLFHATSRRNAIPLIPASIAILKGTSILTAATALSRILISFFPLGTLAAFKMARAGKWFETDVVEPVVSENAKEFWKTWCEGETGKWLTNKEANEFLGLDYNDQGGLRSSDGRIAYPIPFPHSKFRSRRGGGDKTPWSPKTLEEMDHSKRHTLRWIQKAHFWMPDLPEASKTTRSWLELSSTEKQQVEELRKYWIGIKAFKDWYRRGRAIIGTIFWLPFLLLAVVYIAALERVPLTGRWRLILLTPEEEDTVSNSLAGPNWYKSVINLLTTPEKPAPPIVPPNDWRYQWVQSTLSRLENAILADCNQLPEDQKPTPAYPPATTIPPPPYHPIKPRPRVSSMLHSVLPGGEPNSGQEHLEVGPPYNLMLMDKDEENAFSYGFGGKRAGGIVVFTGLLDMVLRDTTNVVDLDEIPKEPVKSKSFFSSLFSSSTPTSNRQPHSQPTEEQTLRLACVLAHEMGHLLLSHHLEALSQQQVLWPSILGFTMDLVRAFIWPITWFLGPTLNDALANMGRTSTDELVERFGELGFQYVHEYEADLAGLRILALAGYEPQKTLTYFSTSVADLHEIQPVKKLTEDNTWTGSMFKLWTRATHPSPEQRKEAIKDELDRWKREREKEEQSELANK
ncbi:uncharacterized protein IL334_003497 [Kwoniella shivajii]|uniref:Peptidase M48 domain-containing protein n=1 Tax=Kwoniella shivajii TaxID=564305 RepID=A0ABZ1CYA1_9TREE|nr:hypothetical protein IL334_003497 [Kwoniella shivajii]